MKIKYLIATAAAMLVSALPLGVQIPAIYADESEEDTLISADFEDGNLGNWVIFGGGNLSVDSENAHSGNSSLRVTDRGGTYHGPSMHCDTIFTAGESYEFDSWVCNGGNVTSTIAWTIKYIDTNGQEAYMQVKGVEAAPGEWVELSNTVLMPENAVSYMIYFECSDAGAAFNVDDITVTGKANEAAVTTPKIIDYQEEYTYDFETDSEMWVARGETNIIHTDEYSKTGSHSIYVTNRSEVWSGTIFSIKDKVRKEEEYYYSAYVMYNGEEYEDSHVFRLEMQYIFGGNECYNLIAEKELKKGKWTKIEGFYTIPQDAESMQIYVQTANLEEGEEPTENDHMSFYVDNVYISEGAIARHAKTMRTVTISVISSIIAAVIILIAVKIALSIRKNKLALKLVSIDAMTQVLNRNSYEKKIEELENDTEQCRQLYYALCDVNFLKYINDNHGHEMGDEAITRCARMLSDATGADCKVYRTGGDEFVCISRVPIADKIRSAIAAESAIDKGYPFAVACGFAVYDEHTAGDIKAIIAQCDKEMYADKQRIKAQNQKFSRK